MPDRYFHVVDTPAMPSRRGFAVTPNDSTDFFASGDVPKRVWVGGAGTLVVQLIDDAAPLSIPNVPAGTMLEIRPAKIMATGTTATLIVALC